MGKLTVIALTIVASVTTGCSTCMQSSYYDPCGGVCYGPSVKAPTFLTGHKKHKHDEHSCPLCNAEAPPTPVTPVNADPNGCCQHGHGTSWTSTTNYGAAFGQPVPAQGNRSPNCACPSPQNCADKCGGKCSCGKRSQACQGKGQPHCSCSTPVSCCNVCDPCQHHFPSAICDTCSTVGDSFSGVVYDEPIISDSFSSTYSPEPMILPGETIIDGGTIDGGTVLPETFNSSGDCPHCQSTSGPIFEGTILPGQEQTQPYGTDKPTGPAPAPAAEPAPTTTEEVPGETVTPTPEPEPLPASASMMIPTFPSPKPARQVHWVPNKLK